MTRCPKCRGRPKEYVELWKNHTIAFAAKSNGEPEESGWLSEGVPYAVEARCECGHAWRLRGVRQITELRTGMPALPAP